MWFYLHDCGEVKGETTAILLGLIIFIDLLIFVAIVTRKKGRR